MPNARAVTAALAGLTVSVILGATLVAAGPASARIPQPGHRGHHRHTAAAVHRSDAAAAAPAPAGSYHAVPPVRALDSRPGSPVPKQGTRTVQIGGVGSVPTSGVAAVAVTITARNASGVGGLALYAAGAARPATTNLVFSAGRDSTTFAVSRVSSTGAMTIFNRAPSSAVDVIVDVSGYYTAGTATNDAGTLHSVSTPARVRGATVMQPGATVYTVFGGANGVPSDGVGAVAVAISAFSPTRTGSLVAYAKGNDRPAAPSAHFVAGEGATSFAIVPTNRYGTVSLYNASAGSVTVVLDLVGWFPQGVATVAGGTQPRFPYRSVNGALLAAGRTAAVPVAGVGGVPRTGVSAVLASLTVASATRVGSISDSASVTNLHFSPGRTVGDLVLLRLDSDGRVRLTDRSTGSLRFSFDIVGFVPTNTLAVPGVSVSRYLGDLTGRDQDLTTMADHGCDDARAGSTFVLLDVGAQSITSPLSRANPGVLLTQTPAGTDVRLSYAQLVARVTMYVSGFKNCAAGRAATVAVGTNNDGDFDGPYQAPTRGADWADRVVDAAIAQNTTNLAIIGANDIEPGFASTQAQAQAWESAYLRATGAGLIFNGSADGCPDGFGRPSGSCANGYTELGLYGLAHDGGRIHALPQIYRPSDAAKWANIDRTGGAGLVFTGSLTEHAVDPSTYTPQSGYAALYYAIASLRTPSIGIAADITNG